MTFNRECEYALKGMIALAAQRDPRPLMLAEIAARGDLPISFLSKIFQKLLRHGLVASHRGARRGYTLTRAAAKTPLRAILEAVEGPDLFDRCVFPHRLCDETRPCPMHSSWQDARALAKAAFEKTTLQDLTKSGAAQTEAIRPARQRRA
jgi:Rrf2 family transcriptional regulator, iron-sulfur cluster assembly transcription factor